MKMRKLFWLSPVLLVFATIGAPTVLRADSITYNVDLAVGADSVTGTITTDGKTGVLTSSDIVSWALLLTFNPGGGIPIVDAGPQPNGGDSSQGVLLTATPTALSFGFSTGNGQQVLQMYKTILPLSLPSVYSSMEIISIDGLSNVALATCADPYCDTYIINTQSYEGTVVLGKSVVTPEPGTATLALTGIGLLGLLVVMRKRYARSFPQAP
jgi:hypothetical protein